jgi:Sel1 repeat
LRDDRDKTLVEFMLQVDHPPTDMAFEAFLRADGETFPLGPIGWAKEQAAWWAFDLDLPGGITQVDVVLKTSAQAAIRLSAAYPHRRMNVDAIWNGPEIVLPGASVHPQRISMIGIKPPSRAEALEYAVAEMDPIDSVVQELKRDGDLDTARIGLEQRSKEQPVDATTRYELGCVLMGTNDLALAMTRLVEARGLEPSPVLLQKIQRQQRRLCALWLHSAQGGNAPAMSTLGAAYEHGWGVGSVLQEAKRWYRLAANGGDAEGMCRLASIYERKLASTVATEQADQWYHQESLAWYRKAADLGNEEAKRWVAASDH